MAVDEGMSLKRSAEAVSGDSCKRRAQTSVVIAPDTSSVMHSTPKVRLRKQNDEEADLYFQFEKTPSTSSRRLGSLADFHALLKEETAKAEASMQTWVRQPDVSWISEMVDELRPEVRKQLTRRHRMLQATTVPENNFHGRWAETSDFASLVLEMWLEDKTLSDVLARSEKLGHLDSDVAGGYILEGEFIKDACAMQNVTCDQLKPMMQKLCSNEEDLVSMYTICDNNCFEQQRRQTFRVDEVIFGDGRGSLNTTWTYKHREDRSGVSLLDDFFEIVHNSLSTCVDADLNRRMYLIWKFQHYVTSYHQDVHVPPHFTLYNQVSGFSIFHFLPVLVGIYVTQVGRRSPDRLHKVLHELDQKSIGSLAVIGPGQAAFIHPFYSHGVWVPAQGLNPTLPQFEVSLIRAAEMFLRPLYETHQDRLKRRNWNNVIRNTTEDLKQLQNFAAFQKLLCRDMNLVKEEWLWMARMTWEVWDSEGRGWTASSSEESSDAEEATKDTPTEAA